MNENLEKRDGLKVHWICPIHHHMGFNYSIEIYGQFCIQWLRFECLYSWPPSRTFWNHEIFTENYPIDLFIHECITCSILLYHSIRIRGRKSLSNQWRACRMQKQHISLSSDQHVETFSIFAFDDGFINQSTTPPPPHPCPRQKVSENDVLFTISQSKRFWCLYVFDRSTDLSSVKYDRVKVAPRQSNAKHSRKVEVIHREKMDMYVADILFGLQ